MKRVLGIKNWIVLFVVLVSVIIVFVGSVNFTFDPLYQYRKPTLYQPYYNGNQRYKNAGLAKNWDYNSIVVGSSMTENFLISDLKNLCKTR